MKIRRKLRHKKAHIGMWVAVVLFVFVAVIGVYAVRGVIEIGEAWCEDLPDITDTESFKYTETTTIYANDGQTVLAEFYLKQQIPVTYDDIGLFVLLGTV
ncbi:MAG: penicillin-binding protein, partial [Eggerthellaceae bacterium]|nr:penicillin-binding protein [Eggerthellaceae bacterium]